MLFCFEFLKLLWMGVFFPLRFLSQQVYFWDAEKPLILICWFHILHLCWRYLSDLKQKLLPGLLLGQARACWCLEECGSLGDFGPDKWLDTISGTWWALPVGAWSNEDCGGLAPKASKENSINNWSRDYSSVFWQRMWLPFAYILRICLRLNCKGVKWFYLVE